MSLNYLQIPFFGGITSHAFFPFHGLWHSIIFVAFRVLQPLVYSSPIPSYENRRYVGAWLDDVMGCSITIQSLNISHVCTSTPLAYNVVSHVLKITFYISFGAFLGVANRSVINLVCRSNDTGSGLR